MTNAIDLKIMAHSLYLFSTQGFNETTTNEIAKKAKVSEATIFRNFKTKYDLYLATLQYYSDQAVLEPNQTYTKLSFTNIINDLSIIMNDSYQFYFDHIHILRIFIANAIQFQEVATTHFFDFLQVKEMIFNYLSEIEKRGLLQANSLDHITDRISEIVLQAVISRTIFEKELTYNDNNNNLLWENSLRLLFTLYQINV